MALGKCCCCVELRTGAIIIAVLGLIASFGSFQHGVVIGIIFFVYGLVQNLCLLHGAIKYNRTTTLVYLIMEAIFIILLLVNWIVHSWNGQWWGQTLLERGKSEWRHQNRLGVEWVGRSILWCYCGGFGSTLCCPYHNDGYFNLFLGLCLWIFRGFKAATKSNISNTGLKTNLKWNSRKV